MCYTQICPRFECWDEHNIHTCVYCVLTLNAGTGRGVFVCVKDRGMLRKRFDFQKHTTSIIGQMYEILRCFCFKSLYWSLVDMHVKLSTSDPIAIISYLFLMFFVQRYTQFADRSHTMFTMWESPMM